MMAGSKYAVLIVALLCLGNAMMQNSTVGTSPLGPYKVSTITVSGISSGAYMAVQMHISYSMIISGAASFAGVSSKYRGSDVALLLIAACDRFLRAHSIAQREV